MKTRVIDVTSATFDQHPLHRGEDWSETNCGFDALWEMLHALRLDPMPLAAVALSSDYEGDQWQMFKIPPEDLYAGYGIELHEMNAYRPVLDHLLTQVGLGRLMTVEVDSYFLPDTVGVSYRLEHVKTGVIVNEVDAGARRLGYFHNAGYFELDGEDFDAILAPQRPDDSSVRLAPYLEVIRLERLRRPDEAQTLRLGLDLLRKHLRLRPDDDPVLRMAAYVEEAAARTGATNPDAFHKLAFSTLRQLGSAAFTGALLCRWLAERGAPEPARLTGAAEELLVVSGTAKSTQLKLARLARGREVDLSGNWTELSQRWAAGQALLDPYAA